MNLSQNFVRVQSIFPRLSGTCGAKLASSGRSNLPDWKTLTSEAHQQLGGYVIHICPLRVLLFIKVSLGNTT